MKVRLSWEDMSTSNLQPPTSNFPGMRRRGITPAAINNFCREIGITRNDNIIPMHKLEHHVRADLDSTSPRTLAVLRPLKVCNAGIFSVEGEHHRSQGVALT